MIKMGYLEELMLAQGPGIDLLLPSQATVDLIARTPTATTTIKVVHTPPSRAIVKRKINTFHRTEPRNLTAR
jgi:hypothetical protein